MQAALSATPVVLTVEIDSRLVAGGFIPPEPLQRDSADVLASAMANDLHRILGDDIRNVGLIMTGALYDLTELLRPGLPMAEMFLDVYRGSLRGGPFEPHLIALGTAAGRFPVPEMAPARAPGSGPLLALPFALVAPGPELDRIRERLESELLEKGGASLDTDRTVRQQFGLEPIHTTYATFHDLSALLRVQLDHAGFGALWQVVEGALYRPDEPMVVDDDSGLRLLQFEGRVWVPVLTLGQWHDRRGNDDTSVESGYCRFQRVLRQYMAACAAHGLEVIPVEARPGVFAASAETALAVAQQAALADPTRLTETVSGDTSGGAASAVTLTEHAAPELGPIAYTALVQAADGTLRALINEYPLAPEAIPGLREHWQAEAARLDAGFRFEQPGRILIGGDPPHLMPYLDYEGTVQ